MTILDTDVVPVRDDFDDVTADAAHRAFWDGVARGYIPTDNLTISPRLKLHTAQADTVDPITYEVIRYSLLNANFEHSSLIQKLCVSPVTMLTRDFQASVLTEIGDLVFLGPNLQYFSNAHSLTIKWILENRSDSPGVNPDDMYLSNDPYVGAPHQPDVAVAAPVFVGDELFCWVANIMHHADLGGSQPGSFCLDAVDSWQDPPSFPPIKIVEHGVIRKDLEEMFTRQSRLPEGALMDLRAAISANTVTKAKILKLVERYGADVVKASMYRTLDASESVFVDRLAAIPDGTWSHRAYTEACAPGDRGIYRYQINVTKRGLELFVDNEGSDPQAGAINITFVAFAGAVLAALTQSMVSDLAGAYGGVYRRVKFNPKPGTLNCADFPAAVSPSGAYTTEMNINCAVTAIGKMLLCGDDSARGLALGPSIPHFYSIIYSGQNANDDYYVMPNTNGMMGAIGAMPARDGVDVGGHFWIPEGVAFNVEQIEAQYPVIYLYRRILEGGADGAGRHRGGLGFAECSMPWGGSSMMMGMYNDESFPKSQGQLGGNPGGRAFFRLKRNSNVAAVFRDGHVPQDLQMLTGDDATVVFRGVPLPIGQEDVWEWSSPGASGHGDPLLRDPDLVLADVRTGHFAEETVDRVYGVAIRDGAIDQGATATRRQAMFTTRLGS
jgi:N-methylhydantoinase B